jgi:hypothetical protein
VVPDSSDDQDPACGNAESDDVDSNHAVAHCGGPHISYFASRLNFLMDCVTGDCVTGGPSMFTMRM